MDESIWGYAKDNGFVIVSKDSYFHQLSFLAISGFPKEHKYPISLYFTG